MEDLAYTHPTSQEEEIPFVITGDTLSGIESLAQRVITILCTQISETLRENEGTNILTMLGNGSIQPVSAKMLITAASASVLSIIKNSEDSNTSNTERIRDIEIANVVCTGDTVSCTIIVTNTLDETTTTATSYTL